MKQGSGTPGQTGSAHGGSTQESLLKWNYRVIRSTYTDTSQRERVRYVYALHEVYYDREQHVGMISQDAAELIGENIEELRHAWVTMAQAFGLPILDFDNIPSPSHQSEKDSLCNGLEVFECSDDWEGLSLDSFDLEGYLREKETERQETEKEHYKRFVGTPILKQLINKLYADYRRSQLKVQRTDDEWPDPGSSSGV